MKKGRMGINIVTSLLQQIVAVVCGFIVPRLILEAYGAEYHGIVNSVTQFLSCVTLLRAGVGGVTRAALYKSLAENNIEKTSAIVKATEQFMRKIALIFSVALIVFAALYPFLVKEEFDWFFSFSLVLILGISTVVQYYFGITNQFLLHTDQRLYISNLWQTAATILNTLFTVILIRVGCGIHAAKLGSAVAFSLTPVMLYLYVRKRYALIRDIEPDFGALQQRWDAFAHQLAAFIHSNTDIMVLTVFTNLKQVSVYSVYSAVVASLNGLIASAANAVEASLGRILASENQDALREKVDTYELLMHLIGTFAFSCAAILIVPFVMIYTDGISEVNYNQPLMGYLMCLGYWITVIRLPYQNVIEAAGHFRETKHTAIIEAVLNVGLSCVLVLVCGPIGVVIGTVVAMGYRTICYAIYASKVFLKQSILQFIKRLLVSAVSMAAVFVPAFLYHIPEKLSLFSTGYAEWIIVAVIVAFYVAIVTVLINGICYYDKAKRVIRLFFKKKA